MPDALVAQAASAPRPLILFVHGRAQQHRLADELLRTFRSGLRDGLRRIGDGTLADRIQDHDVRIVSYYDLYMPTEPAVEAVRDDCAEPPKRITNRGAPSSPFAFTDLDGTERKAMLNLVERLPFVPDASLMFLEDTRAYLDHPGTRCATNWRLRKELHVAEQQNRPVILVAHSMGSLVAFDVLATYATRTSTRMASTGPPAPGVVRRVVLLGTQLPADGLRSNLSDGVDPRLLRADAVGTAVLFKGRFDWVGMRTHDGKAFVDSATTFQDLEIDTDPDDPHAVSSYLQHPLVALAIAAPFCEALPGGCTAEMLELSACDHDIFARRHFANRHRGDSTKQLEEFAKWTERGRRESSGLLLSPLFQWTHIPSFSGKEEHLSPRARAACTATRSDVRSSYTRNPSDSIRPVSVHFGLLGIASRGRDGRAAVSAELGIPLLDLLPLRRLDLATFVGRDIRFGYEHSTDDEETFYARVHLKFGVYGRVRLRGGSDGAPRESIGLSLGHHLSQVTAFRSVFSHQLNRPGNDLFIEYAPAGTLVTMGRVAVGARYVAF